MENNKTKIKVVDSIIGQGKTTWAINYMKENPDKRFLFVTPFLDEVERVMKEVPNMKSPYINFKEGKPKFETLRDLTFKGDNIATTHALFSKLDMEMKENLTAGDYILILDEVTNVAERFKFETESDEEMFFNEMGDVDKEGYVFWLDDKYKASTYKKKSAFYDVMLLCLNKNLIKVKENMYMWELPISSFNCFKDIYILTYMFEGSILAPYFKLNNVQYEYLSVSEGKLTKYNPTTKEQKAELKQLINIVEHEKLNEISDNYWSLSASWHKDKTRDLKTSIYSKKLKANTTNFFKNICKGNAKDNMVTVFDKSYEAIKDKGWSSKVSSYIAFNMKATNKFRHKKNLAYLVNVFVHGDISTYFKQRHPNINVNEKIYALNILIQWIWRSRVRNQDLPYNERYINLYLPSRRMRDILKEWLDSDDSDINLNIS